MKLKYYIEATEKVESHIDLKPKELTKLKREAEAYLNNVLKSSGMKLTEDIKLEFDLEED